MKISNSPKKNIIILNQFEELLNLNINNIYNQINYSDIYYINLIKKKYKNNIEKMLFSKFEKKNNTLVKIINQINFNKSNYRNNFYKVNKKNLIYLRDFDVITNQCIFHNNHIKNKIKENKKNYDTIIFSNYDQRYAIKNVFYQTNFFQQEKYNFYFNKKKIFNLIDLSISNLENSNNKFDHSESNFLLDIGEITLLSNAIFINEKKDNLSKFILLVDHDIFNIKNLIKEVIKFSVLRDDSIKILNFKRIDPETPIISYIPIKKNESIDRTLHLVPWFILFFFIVLLMTSFYSFKKLTKKIEDSNMNIIYNTQEYLYNLKKFVNTSYKNKGNNI